MTDTTREAVESLIGLIDHNKSWEGLQEVDVEAYQQAADTLRALLAAKEAAEAERDNLRSTLQQIAGVKPGQSGQTSNEYHMQQAALATLDQPKETTAERLGEVTT